MQLYLLAGDVVLAGNLQEEAGCRLMAAGSVKWVVFAADRAPGRVASGSRQLYQLC
jgi:hypothetical protein